MAESPPRTRLATDPLPPLVEVPEQCTLPSGCDNLPEVGDRNGRCAEHRIRTADESSDFDMDFDIEQPFLCG